MEISEFPRDISVSALPPKLLTQNANPKVISERTSYYQARLAFHFLPQLIRRFCTVNRFGPPPAFRRGSTWPWQARLASGLNPSVPHKEMRPIKTWFPCAFASKTLRLTDKLNSLARSTKSTPSYFGLAASALRVFVSVMVSGTISLSSPDCFSHFPHGTRALSVTG